VPARQKPSEELAENDRRDPEPVGFVYQPGHLGLAAP
jgi:hypothetical protein